MSAIELGSVKSGRASTFFVAANDSSDLDKFMAQYICDAVSDQTELNAALAAVNANGGSVWMSEGTFIIDGYITVIRAATMFRGMGNGTIIKVKDSAGTGGFALSSHIYVNAASFTISDFKVNANRTNNAAHSAYATFACGASATGKIVIENVWVDDFPTYGFSLSSAANGARILNCRASNGKDGGIGFLAQDGGINNAFFNCIADNNVGSGFHSQATRTTFMGCVAYSNTGDGFQTAYSTSIDNMFQSNVAYSNSGAGFATISAAVRPKFKGNTSHDNGTHGISVVATTVCALVEGNTSHSNSTAAANAYDNIRVAGDYSYVINNTTRKGANANKPGYGINISAGTGNHLGENDTYDGGNTGEVANSGTSTVRPSFVQAAVAGGDTINTTAAETNFATNFALLADQLKCVGRVIRIRAWGTMGTHSSGTVTLQLKLKAGSTTLLDFAAQTLAVSISARRWFLEADITVAAVGASGSLECAGVARLANANTDIGYVSPAVGSTTTVDTTAAQTIQISAQHGASNAANTVTMRQFTMQILN